MEEANLRKDLMIALGVLGDSDGLFFEGSGIVSKVGSKVTQLKVGDRVICLGRGLCTTRKIVPAKNCIAASEDVSLEDAASLPIIFMTVVHSLLTLANLQEDQSVLIHSACGGVGLAAIQVSRMVGANIFVTVGSKEKADYLVNELGIPRDHIFDSRSPSFLQGVLEKTNNKGVDVVLNSLSGELLHASWRCVRTFGKMVEIGKRDLLGHGKLDMDMFEGNRSFIGFDLAHMFDEDEKGARK